MGSGELLFLLWCLPLLRAEICSILSRDFPQKSSEGRRAASCPGGLDRDDTGQGVVVRAENGTEDIWWILEGQDYPRLWWALIAEN